VRRTGDLRLPWYGYGYVRSYWLWDNDGYGIGAPGRVTRTVGRQSDRLQEQAGCAGVASQTCVLLDDGLAEGSRCRAGVRP
jgi:hypothetical protein